MSPCCVIGCKNRHSRNSSLKFYRIPCGLRPFHVHRRRLWVKAIQQANGNTKELTGNPRICGAHFISGEASMDTNSQDFVPSVFPSSCTKPSRSPQKMAERIYDPKKSSSGSNSAGNENIMTGPEFPVDLQDVSMETENEVLGTIQTQSPPPVPKEEDGLIKVVTKTETVELQETSSSNITSHLKPSEVFSQLKKLRPVVVLKHIVVPKGIYHCEQRDPTCTGVSELVEDKQLHSDLSQADPAELRLVPRIELSFPCNMCDRSFPAIHHLKRHKLLHIKDNRKCLRCGVLFCRRHNHFFFQPKRSLQKAETESEDESSGSEVQDLNSILSPKKMEPSPIIKIVIEKPPPVSAALAKKPPAPDQKLLPGILRQLSMLNRHNLMSVKPSPVPPPPTPIISFLKSTIVSFHLKSQVLDCPPVFVQSHLPIHPELPPSLELFSPQYLTSAFLDVQRNYEYILSKVPTSSNKPVVKEEEEPVIISPVQQPNKKAKKEKIAYDLEVIL